MKRVLPFLLLLVGLIVPSPAAAKGGWATVSYDPLPALVSGETVGITFRVLQHGVSPVDAGDWIGTAMEVEVAGGTAVEQYPAEPTGDLGRFGAAIAVPDGPQITLRVVWDGGLLLQQEPIAVPVVAEPEGWAAPPWLPYGLGALGMAGAGLVISDVRARRRRPAGVTEGPTLVPSP